MLAQIGAAPLGCGRELRRRGRCWGRGSEM